MTAAPVTTRFEFRLLGPLEVSRDGALLRLGGDRQRALLALLLLHANEVVPSDVLVDELFGGERSDSALNAVQVAVSRLRRLLADGNGPTRDALLATQSPGYVLRAQPEQLDVTLFERLVGEGRRALEDGDATAASARLREALALWRGPPLADIATFDFAAAEIRRLEELKLAAVMDRVDADLAQGRGADIVPEVEALVAAQPLQERLRGQLMLALYRAGRQADALEVYRDTHDLLSNELGLEPSRALQQLERSILQQDESLEVVPRKGPLPAPGPDELVICPFKGLAFFDVADRDYFCGREQLVDDLISRLVGSTFAGIVGPSGAGKSSVLRAGVVSALSAGVLPGSEDWHVAVVRPGADPMAELERSLGGPLRDAVARVPQGARLVIAVDQLEELFTATADEDTRARFVDALVEAADDPQRRALVVVALRADFYGRCAAFSRFAELLSGNHVLVGPMDRAELRRAIELPAARAGLQVESRLVDALVADVSGEPGALPLLSTSLLELWRDRDGRMLGYAHYRAAGGVHGAVARLAETAYGGLEEPEQQVARTVMLRLSAGDGRTVVRRRVPVADLDLEHDEATARVLFAFTEARLVTATDGSVEVSHEALLREWPRFREWLDEDREGRRLHEHLGASAREWNDRGRDSDDLYRGARLAAALDWMEQHARELNALEREFVDQSRAEGERELRSQRLRNRRLRVLLASVGGLLVLAVVAGAVALTQRHDAQDRARAALARQLGAEAIVEPRIDRAMLLAREAVRLDRSPATEGTLLSTLLRSPAALATFPYPIDRRPLDIAVRPDGRVLVVTDNHGELRFLDTRTRRELRPQLRDISGGFEPSFSRTGGRLLVVGMHGNALALEVLDGKSFRHLRFLTFDHRFLTTPTNPVQPTTISPDGSNALSAYALVYPDFSDGAAYLDVWDVGNGRLRTVPIGSDGIVGASFSRGGRRIVTVTRSEIATWDAHTLRRLAVVNHASSGLAAVSPDGRTVAVGTLDGQVSFVDVATGKTTNAPSAHSAGVQSLEFSPDGRILVTTADDARVVLWDVATGQPTQTLLGHGGRIISASFTGDGQTLYSSSLDGALFEWDAGRNRRFGRPFDTGPTPEVFPEDIPATPPLAVAPDGSRFAARVGGSAVGVFSARTLARFRLLRLPSTVTSVAWSPAGEVLAVGTAGGDVRLWPLGDPGSRRTLRALHGPVQSVAWGPGGLLAAVSLRHTTSTQPPAGELALWRPAARTTPLRVRSFSRQGTALAFSRDGARMAVGLGDGRVLLVDPASGRTRRTLEPIGDPNVALAFAPDGTLATGSWAGIVQRWNASSGAQLGHPVLAAAAPVASLSFSPDGALLATTGGSDGLAKLWRTETLQQFGSNFPGEQGHWGTAVFTPDSQRLVVVYDDGKGDVWPTSVPAWNDHACRVAGRTLTREEWSRYVTGRTYARVCP